MEFSWDLNIEYCHHLKCYLPTVRVPAFSFAALLHQGAPTNPHLRIIRFMSCKSTILKAADDCILTLVHYLPIDSCVPGLYLIPHILWKTNIDSPCCTLTRVILLSLEPSWLSPEPPCDLAIHLLPSNICSPFVRDPLEPFWILPLQQLYLHTVRHLNIKTNLPAFF